MCGIIGYVGKKEAKPILINGLLRLEYRGYDSAGIATIEENNIIKIVKDKGRVNTLNEKEETHSMKGTIGIGHTRWATHGKPSNINSHPHLDNSRCFAVVHNGIIENYAELRDFLISKNYTFLSETDTEVIPNLINYYYENSSNNTLTGEEKFLDAVIEATNELKGSYAIEVLSSLYPESMIVVRKDSPLVIGKGENENYISSDIPAILSFTKDFYLLNDREYALVTRNDITFYNSNLEKIDKEVKNITWDAGAAEKDGFDDFMLKEIFEQPKSIRETIGSRLPKDSDSVIEDLNLSKEYLESIKKIFGSR